MFRRILVCLDGSEKSKKGARVGFELAQHFGGNVTLIHVPQSETATYYIEALDGDVDAPQSPGFQQLEAAGQYVLDQALAIAAEAGFERIKTHMPHGHAATEILEYAAETDADLIITGRRGLNTVTGLLLGSTTLKVSQKAKCACLSVV